jgi:diguanylate cyclase (GGDEF)-like protein
MPESLIKGFMSKRTVNSLLLVCFFVVALIPIIILGLKVYNAAWDNAWREIREKHQLLAENLAQPIMLHINSYKNELPVIASLVSVKGTTAFRDDINILFKDYIKNTDGLTGLTLFDAGGNPVLQTYRDKLSPDWKAFNITDKHFFQEALESDKPTVSRVYRSTATGHPALFMAHVIDFSDHSNEPTKVLVSEVNLDRVETIREGIKFGKRGHCAIVDATGHVVAHPNPEWREKIHDLSGLSVVKKMLAGKTGVTEFYSPFVKQMMVAGFASVPGLGWGIMVPQPKSEVRAQVNRIVMSQFGWGGMGLLIAIFLAITLARWITFPINALVKVADEMVGSKFVKKWPDEKISEGPREINRLAEAFQHLVNGLISSRETIKNTNRSLEQQIEKATHDLRMANQQLSLKASQDHLTGLHNRRSFEEHLSNLAEQVSNYNSGDGFVTLIMVDIDDFKEVNDTYGHHAGDAVLTHVSQIIGENMRDNDILARYAGDEFIGIINANMLIARKRADAILEKIKLNPVQYDDQDIEVTVSIGLMQCNCEIERANPDYWEEVMKHVDVAMYEAKKSGKNAIAEVRLETNKNKDISNEPTNGNHLVIIK